MIKQMIIVGMAMLCVCANAYGVKGMKWGVRKSDYSSPKSSFRSYGTSRSTEPTKTGHGINGCGVKNCHGKCCNGGSNFYNANVNSNGGSNFSNANRNSDNYSFSSIAPQTHSLSYNEKLATIRTVNSVVRTAIYARNSFARSAAYKQRYDLACKKFENRKTVLEDADRTIVTSMQNIANRGLTKTETYSRLSAKHNTYQKELSGINSSIKRLQDGSYDLRTTEEVKSDEIINSKVVKLKLLTKKVENDEGLTNDEFTTINNLIKEIEEYYKNKGINPNDVIS